MRLAFTSATLCALALQGCAAPSAATRITGLTASDTKFRMSPGGCSVSLIFDDFRGQRGPGIKIARDLTRRFIFAGAPNHHVTVDIAGSLLAPAAYKAAVVVQVGEARQSTPLSSGAAEQSGGNFTVSIQAETKGSKDGTMVTVTLEVPEPDDAAASVTLDIDTIDLALKGEKSCA